MGLWAQAVAGIFHVAHKPLPFAHLNIVGHALVLGRTNLCCALLNLHLGGFLRSARLSLQNLINHIDPFDEIVFQLVIVLVVDGRADQGGSLDCTGVFGWRDLPQMNRIIIIILKLPLHILMMLRDAHYADLRNRGRHIPPQLAFEPRSGLAHLLHSKFHICS